MENHDTRTFKINSNIEMKPVRFKNRFGIELAGHLYLPEGYAAQKNAAIYDAAHPFPEDSDRARCYGSVLPQLGKLIEKIRQIGSKYNVSPA